jgi:hypothetical protein
MMMKMVMVILRRSNHMVMRPVTIVKTAQKIKLPS